ncbi:hypothetical protein [Aquipuribacter nitratireducens]|uniref:Uncharacterized protein n=1 Tax=Aquipuribacter nitratireducens TaxID=650104 RepID=A0ABW0GK78_9MICO
MSTTAVEAGTPVTAAPRRAVTGAAVLRWLGGGLLAGVAWGVAARLWMRYLADVPSFSWEGTLFILGLTGVAGLALGGVELLRRRGVGAWRVLLVVPALVMFAGQGLPFLPCAVLGGLAVSGRGGPGVRLPAALLAASPVVMFWVLDVDVPHSLTVTALWFLALGAALAVAWAPLWRRRASR